MAKLADRRDWRVDKLSGGMPAAADRRALIHRPRLVLLDEPTVGLDPQVRQQLWALIDKLRSEGTRSSCRRMTSRRRSGSPTPF